MNYRIYIALLLVLLLSSCGPINRFTRIKKTPREHSLNYCYSDLKARKTAYNKESWIVFSDRDENDTYHNPGGKVKLKKMSFMEPFFVIGQKGEYLRLVKYDPEIVKDEIFSNKIKDREKAQYYGWVHTSRLLLTRQSGTDVSTGLKSKSLSIISDTTAVVEPRQFFDSDSILTYKDDLLTIMNGKIPFHEILYILKKSIDKEKVLVARKAVISPDESSTEVLGWLSASLVQEVGERLFADIDPLLESSPYLFHFKDKRRNDTLQIASSTLNLIKDYSYRNPALRFSPVNSYQQSTAREVCFTTGISTPVVDRENNYVLNVNGNKIMYRDFMQMERDLKNLNIMFVFEGKNRVLYNFPEIMNVIQNLQLLFNQPNDDFNYKFGTVISYNGELSDNSYKTVTKSIELTDSYADVLEFLTQEKEKVSTYRPVPTSNAWEGLRKAVDMLPSHGKETNLMIIVGEEGYSESADSSLVRRIADANCRILGYQVHSEVSNTGNNFVLQVENMITHCAQHESVVKREKIVYPDQVKAQSRFRESSRNVYTLDYPENSMTQGWLLFPDKSVDVPILDILSSAIDTFVMEVKTDNNLIINSLYNAFETVGNSRYKYNSLWADYNDRDSSWLLKKEFPQSFSRRMPAWYLKSLPVSVQVTDEPDYHLLLSENELKDVLAFLETLCKYEPDYKYLGRPKKTKRKLCNCPDDDLYNASAQSYTIMTDAANNPQYLSTRKIRRHLYKLYLKELKAINRLCKTRTGQFKSYSLDRAQREIVGNPSDESMLEKYMVRDIKRKKTISDHELDKFILYVKNQRDKLDQHIRLDQKDVFTSNGQTYYWISSDLLP